MLLRSLLLTGCSESGASDFLTVAIRILISLLNEASL